MGDCVLNRGDTSIEDTIVLNTGAVPKATECHTVTIAFLLSSKYRTRQQ